MAHRAGCWLKWVILAEGGLCSATLLSLDFLAQSPQVEV